ncbi:MAG: SRPBCC family protein [Bauldia sp.]
MNAQAADTIVVTTPNDLEVVTVRAFAAPRALVFEAHTKPELVKRWLLGPPGWTMPVCEIDLRVGGKLRYVWKNEADGKSFGMTGVFKEIVVPERLVHTEFFSDNWTGGEALITTTFTEKGGKTTVTITMRFASKEARDGAVATGMTDGMESSYRMLEEVLKSAAAA